MSNSIIDQQRDNEDFGYKMGKDTMSDGDKFVQWHDIEWVKLVKKYFLEYKKSRLTITRKPTTTDIEGFDIFADGISIKTYLMKYPDKLDRLNKELWKNKFWYKYIANS